MKIKTETEKKERVDNRLPQELKNALYKSYTQVKDTLEPFDYKISFKIWFDGGISINARKLKKDEPNKDIEILENIAKSI